MTEDERHRAVSHMERMIREFRVVTAGAQVMGGFGRLPKSEGIEERVTNIERAIKKFHLEGNGIRVGGDFDNGFVLW